jgi:hypothetical protein
MICEFGHVSIFSWHHQNEILVKRQLWVCQGMLFHSLKWYSFVFLFANNVSSIVFSHFYARKGLIQLTSGNPRSIISLGDREFHI